ncbi:MAG: class I adenylate-forming enzyme family protein [Candidatus Freyarchaeota archaeon]
MLLGDMVDMAVRRHANELCFVDITQKKRFTFKEFGERIYRLANGLLGLGIKKGDRVAILQGNCHQYLETLFAIFKMGAIAVPLNIRLSGQEIAYQINDSEANTLIIGESYLELLKSIKPSLKTVKFYICFEKPIEGMRYYEDLIKNNPAMNPEVDLHEDDPFMIQYTSGTTGVPKGAVLTHKGAVSMAYDYMVHYGFYPRDRLLYVFPYFHVAVLIPITCFWGGGVNVTLRGFNPQEIAEVIQNEKINCCPLVPTMAYFLFSIPNIEKYDFSSIRGSVFGAFPLSETIAKKSMEIFPGGIAQSYGCAETTATVLLYNETREKIEAENYKTITSCGKEMMGVQVRIVDDEDVDVPVGEVGEIIVKGDRVMKEYWKKPKETAEALRGGWFHTGDLARMDEQGYVYIVDRKKDMIKTGGENVYPVEVENVIQSHPAVMFVGVIGTTDEKWGEVPMAVIQLKPGVKPSEELKKEIIEHCRARLAHYKAPKKVVFAETMPMTAAGKVLKRELRKIYSGK